MLIGLKNNKHWAITLQSIFENEDLWDLIEPLTSTMASLHVEPYTKIEQSSNHEQSNNETTCHKRRVKSMI